MKYGLTVYYRFLLAFQVRKVVLKCSVRLPAVDKQVCRRVQHRNFTRITCGVLMPPPISCPLTMLRCLSPYKLFCLFFSSAHRPPPPLNFLLSLVVRVAISWLSFPLPPLPCVSLCHSRLMPSAGFADDANLWPYHHEHRKDLRVPRRNQPRCAFALDEHLTLMHVSVLCILAKRHRYCCPVLVS